MSPTAAGPVPSVAGVPRFALQGGHSGGIASIAWSPDDSLLATGSREDVKVWDARTGVVRATLGGHREGVAGLAWSPDGTMLASCDIDAVRLWDARTGAEKWHAPVGSRIQSGSLVVSADGATIMACDNGDARSWSLATGVERPRVSGAEHPATAPCVAIPKTLNHYGDAAWSADGKRVAQVADGIQVVVLDAASGAQISSFKPPTAPGLGRLAWAPGGEPLVVTHDATIEVFDPSTGARRGALELPAEHASAYGSTSVLPATSFGWSHGGGRLAIGMMSGSIHLVDTTNWSRQRTLAARPLTGKAAINGTRTLLLTQSYAATSIWDLKRGTSARLPSEYDDATMRAAWNPVRDEVAVAAMARHGAIGVFDGRGALLRSVSIGDANLIAQHVGGDKIIAFSPDGSRIAATSFGGIAVVDAQLGVQAVDPRVAGISQANAMAFSPDGTLLAAVGRQEGITNNGDGTSSGRAVPGVFVWETQAQPAAEPLGWHQRFAHDIASDSHLRHLEALAWSPDGRAIAVAGEPGLYVVDLQSRDVRALVQITGDSIGSIASVAFSPGGASLAATSETGSILVFDTRTWTQRTLPAHGAVWVGWIDDATLVSSGDEVRLHHVSDGSSIGLRFSQTTEGQSASLVYTDDGLFDGDDAAFSQVLFRVGDDLRTADIVSADQLFERYHRPGLLRDFLAGKPTELASDLKAGVGLPPGVEILQPPSGPVDRAAIDLRVRAVDRGGGVTDVRVFVNGKRADGGRALVLDTRKNLGTSERTFTVQLAPGENVVEAEAYNVIGNLRSERARVKVALAAQPARPSLFLLGHTIDDYGDDALRLRFANADGDALLEQLRAGAGTVFGDVQLVRLRDKEATPRGLDGATKSIAAKAGPDDVVVFFAAGHGVMVRCPSDEKAHYYLVGYGAHASTKAICETSISDAHLADLLRSIPAQKKVVLLDTCQSGAAATSSALAAMLADTDELDDETKRFGRSEGVAILAAAQPRQSAVEIPELGHGAFTWALIRGLSGEARLAGAKQVMVQSLIAVTSQLLGDVTEKKFGQRQRTTTAYQGDNFPIAEPR